MTTENSVRVPGAAIAELLGGTRDEIDEMAKRTGYSRFPSPEQLRGWRCVIDSAIHHLAAPAPAEEFGPVTEAELDAARAPNPLIVTPQPEQGAGLPEQWKEAAAIYREQGRNDISDVFDDCASALARQQSRVVDHAMVERARQCIVTLRHHLGLFVQDDIALAMFKTAEEIETELRAALEGGRDGR